MNDILKTYMERFRENRHTLRRYTAFVLALAMITTLFVNWQLHGVGISMTAQYQCGEEEHTHTADCYTKVLTCGYEEGELENADEVAAAAATSQPTVEAEPAPLSLEPQIEFVPHEHTDDCYTEVQTLTCMEEEHVHLSVLHPVKDQAGAALYRVPGLVAHAHGKYGRVAALAQLVQHAHR